MDQEVQLALFGDGIEMVRDRFGRIVNPPDFD
jgi:hypothetical protein